MTHVALQIGLPGGPELVILVLIFALLAVVVGRWVYRDARARGSDWAWQWAVGIIFLFFLGLVPGVLGVLVYVLVRGERVEDGGAAAS